MDKLVNGGDEVRVIEFLFVGQQRALDFVNTEIASGGERKDLLAGFDDLVDWLKAAGFVGNRAAASIAASFTSDAKRRKALGEAREFRGVLRSVAGSLADGKPVAARDLDALNAVLRAAGVYEEVVREGGVLQTTMRVDWSSAAGLLASIARATAELLTECDASLVKRCKGAGCILFFCDTTRNHRRRWCSMRTCGNVNKVRAHRDRNIASA